uniref:Trafficking protein particle complex subunit n=1 Tax=Eutreptiella gymnastica TaxID=73025 RepID=A0A7S1IAV6_9EUGL|mmetsp:Transcript_143690/g.250787  ORF Transcript_143690/g.250787 Transcript_143690/m.250787 type:complete len:133 (+) Transcript_143690:44-442(+)
MVGTYFMIIGKNDCPVYEIEDIEPGKKFPQLAQFIMHAALDHVEELMWQTQHFYLKGVDRVDQWLVSAYVTPSYVKFLLMQDGRQEDSVKRFFDDVYELYLKTMLNPFYDVSHPITSANFDGRVKTLLAKYF